MNILHEILPTQVMEFIDTAHEVGVEIYEIVQEQYLFLQNEAKVLIARNLPEDLQPLATKVTEALPETLFAMSVITDMGKGFATFFWIVRVVQVVSPLVQTIVKGQLEKETFDAAVTKSWGQLQGNIERFKPAAFVSCSIAAVYYAILGVASLNLDQIIQGSVFALAAIMSRESMEYSRNQKAQSELLVRVQSPQGVV